MRITCPNCNAQYEVADDLIPTAGRDVQCSNCATTWFQEGRPRATTAVGERAVRRPGRPAEPAAPPAKTSDETDTPEVPAQAEAPAPGRRPMADAETRDILRAEREREERLRAARAARPEASDEGPQTDPRERAAAERARMAAAASVARARDEAPADAVGGASQTDPEEAPSPDDEAGAKKRAQDQPPETRTPKPEEEDVSQDAIADALREAASDDSTYDDPEAAEDEPRPSARVTRRELLPDIEEINSSLRPDERALEAAAARAQVEAQDPETQRSGFRIGFLSMGAVILLAVGAYVFADALARAVPAISPQLDAWVDFIDTQRVALEAGAEALVERLAPDT